MKIISFVRKFKNKKGNIIDNSKKLYKRKEFLGSIPEMKNSRIIFNGKNNIIFCEDGVKLVDCVINFNADNSLIYFSKNSHSYRVNISIYNNSTCYFGKNIYFNDVCTFILSEEKNIILGDNCLISLNVWFRVADPHLIYCSKSKKRLNFSKSIYVGDHVWIGQNVFLLKGCIIGSGSILAANSVVSNIVISSNCIYGGNPVKKIKSDIFWDEKVVHRWKSLDTYNNLTMKTNKYVYHLTKDSINFEKLDSMLCSTDNCKIKIEILKNISIKKNRFYIE